jgi:hypothetical protein
MSTSKLSHHLNQAALQFGAKKRLTEGHLPQKSLLEDFSSQTPLIISEYHKDSLRCDEEEDPLSRVLMRQKVSTTLDRLLLRAPNADVFEDPLERGIDRSGVSGGGNGAQQIGCYQVRGRL